MEKTASEICEHLDEYLQLTRAAAHVRSGMVLQSSGRKTADEMSQGGERWLEAAVFEQWQHATGRPFLLNLCPWLIVKQVPLAAKRAADRWGKVDLIGMSADYEPVIVELKRAKADDSPLRAIIEGVGYAVAVRNNWPEYQGHLKPPEGCNWARVDGTSKVWVTVMAPEEFWRRLSRSKPSCDALPALVSLAGSLEKYGYPVRLATLRVAANRQISDPRWWHLEEGYWPFASIG